MQLPVEKMTQITQIGWGVLVLFWVVSAFTTKRTVRRERDFTRFIYLVFLLIAFTVLMSKRISLEWLTKPLLFQQYGWKFFGFIVTLCGLAFALWARITLGRNWSGTVTVKEDHQLVQNGPYSISRNPIYTGILIAFFGNACL